MPASACGGKLLRPKCPLVRIIEKRNAMKNFHRHFTAALSLVLLLPAIALADPKSDAYQFGKDGIEAAKKKEWDKAIGLFQKAVKADPKEANNYNNLGLAYKGAGKMDDAIKAFGD